MVLVLYTDKYAGDRMQIATLFRKGGAVAMDVRHMFEEKGFVEATLAAAAPAAAAADGTAPATPTEEELTERCTEDAIECGAEECEVLDVQQRRILVRWADSTIFWAFAPNPNLHMHMLPAHMLNSSLRLTSPHVQ